MACQLSNGAEQKRIFIVDDHPMFREALARLITQEADLQVCGEANNAAQALAGIESAKPELVLADIGLPGRSGLELIKDLHTLFPSLAVLAISAHDESVYAERVLHAGGRGYITKQEGARKILHAIRHVLEGQIYLNDKTASRILDMFSGRRANASCPISILTDRELEILQLLGSGKDNHVIAAQLNVSVKTVDAHRGKIKEKLNLRNATELVCYAARWVDTQNIRAQISTRVNVA